MAIFDTPDILNSDAARSDERYHNPFNRGVGKWKIRKKISGGADAHLFAIKSEPPTVSYTHLTLPTIYSV